MAEVVQTPRRLARVAMLGNPNTGKTSLFNSLTGLRQRVGNYPGITVEKKTGVMQLGKGEAELIDLPGTYSLAAASPDERVVVDVLAGHVSGTERPEAIVCVVDATNLQRNLFLVSQVAELGIPIVVALNLWDSARKQGLNINVELLSKRLGVPVVPTIGRTAEGLPQLRAAIVEALEQKPLMTRIQWPESAARAEAELRAAIPEKIRAQLKELEVQRLLFDADSPIIERVGWEHAEARRLIDEARKHLWDAGVNPLAAEALFQYAHLKEILDGVVLSPEEALPRGSESIDGILIHRFWGLLVFVGMMFVVFQAVYAGAGPLMDLVDGAKGWTQDLVGPWFESMPMLQSLVTDGVIEGVGAFVIFLPQILILFLFIALLEDTGYMARAAFLMDKLFNWCGLNGKSFVPFLSSYACAVPGVMATRTIEDPKARLTTILLAPLMSCSARLPVYVLMIGAFVEPQLGSFWAGVALFGMHFVGLFVAVVLAFLFTRFLIKTKPQPFVLELPAYHAPRIHNVVYRMYEAGKEFVQRAGTVILAITIIIWAMLYFPRPADLESNETKAFAAEQAQAAGISEEEARAAIEADEELAAALQARIDGAYVDQSLLGRLGKGLQPIFAPAGFDWKITVGVLASFPAREVIVSTLGIIYSLGGEVDEESGSLREAMRHETWDDGPRAGATVFNLPVVFAIMVFFALCSQCGSTLAVTAKESNWKWAAFTFVYMTSLAWIGAVVVCQVGMMFL